MRAYQTIPSLLLTAAFALSGCASDRRPTPRSPAGPDFSEVTVITEEPTPLAASDGERVIPPDDQVFFAFDSDLLEYEGQMVLAQVAAWMKADRGREVVVQGHADSSGDSAYNMDLSSRRARSVAEYLRSFGVARDRIIVVAEGERAARIEPSEGNRRVVIYANTVEVSSR